MFSDTLLHFACISSISYSLLSLKLMFLVFQAIALDNAIKTTAFLLKVNCVLATAFMFICILVRKENFEKNISLVFSSALDYKYNKKRSILNFCFQTFVPKSPIFERSLQFKNANVNVGEGYKEIICYQRKLFNSYYYLATYQMMFLDVPK